MTGLIGEDLFDPTSQMLKKERQTEDGRGVPLDDEYIRDKLRARGIVSGGDGAVNPVMLEQAVRNAIGKKGDTDFEK